MATAASTATPAKHVYSVWGLPADVMGMRLKKVMDGIRSEFDGPYVVGSIGLTEEEALTKFKAAFEGVKAYDGIADKVDTGTFFYQCVYLLPHPTPEAYSGIVSSRICNEVCVGS